MYGSGFSAIGLLHSVVHTLTPIREFSLEHYAPVTYLLPDWDCYNEIGFGSSCLCLLGDNL